MSRMGIYLYCVIPAGSISKDRLTGIDGAQVLSLIEPPLEYWYSHMERRPEPSIEGIRQHNAVVEAAVSEQVTPLPLRFGQWIDHAERLHERIEPLRARHEQKLNNFQGALEFGLRIMDPREQPHVHAPPVATGSGREYLMALRERQTLKLEPEAEAVAAHVAAQFGSLVREQKIEPLRTAHGLISVAHLVPRAQFAAWRAGVETLREQFPELRFLASGPWPPYSFAT